MNKLRINKKGAIALALAGTIAFGGLTLVIKSQGKKSIPKRENEVGYSDFNPFINWKVDPEDFIVLNVGDHDTVVTHFEHQKMTYCNGHDISLGVIISSDAKTEASIYDDVEYVKGLVSKYSITFPVYLNIDQIITNDDLNNEMKTKLIKDFLEKCSANNIYVGLYGTDTNLCRVKKYCNINEYDTFLVMDKEEIGYDGTHSICQDLEGNIFANKDVSKIIAEKKLNQSSGFANDGYHVISENDNLTDIALRYGMSVSELLEFNNMKKSDVTPGCKLRIPAIIDNTISEDVTTTYAKLDDPLIGCDLSYAQEGNINWQKMSENFEFVILRCSYGTNVDRCFEENAKNASINNLPIGVYCYNEYTSVNSENPEDFSKKQSSQADYVLNLLKNKKIEYPVYLDIEAPDGTNLRQALDKESVQTMLKIWKEKMSASGYIPGIYCNQSGYEYIKSCLDYDLTSEMSVWIAGGDQYTGGTKDISFEEVIPSERVKEEHPNATTFQVTDSAINAGAGNHLGHLSIDYSYIDYTEKEIIGEKKETFPIKEFNREDRTLIGCALLSSCGLVVAASAGTLISNNIKDKNKGKYLRKEK